MLGVCKQDNVTVHGGQMRPRSCRRTRRKQNAVHPFQAEGDKLTAAMDSFCRRQLHSSPATTQRITLNQGMTSPVERGVGNGAIMTTLFAVQRKAGFGLGLVLS